MVFLLGRLLGSFSFSGSKLNSVLDLTVGTLAKNTTISASNGSISTAGTVILYLKILQTITQITVMSLSFLSKYRWELSRRDSHRH